MRSLLSTLRYHRRNIIVICFHALAFAALYLGKATATVNLMSHLLGDMEGSVETDVSGRLYVYFINIHPVWFTVACSWILLALVATVWAAFFEFLRTRGSIAGLFCNFFLGWLAGTVSLYTGISFLACDDLPLFLSGQWAETRSPLYQTFMNPILEALHRGVTPVYIFMYSTLWATMLTVLLAFPWWWLRRRRRVAVPPTPAEHE